MPKFKWKLAQFFELRWWKKYLNNKENYLEYKKNYWLDLISQIDNFSINPNDTLLDIGCGPAGIFMALENHPFDAVDPLIEKYENNIDFFKKANFPNVTFYNSSFEDFSISKSYNKIFCLNAINHFSDLNLSLTKIVNLLPQNGMLILSIDTHHNRFNRNLFRFTRWDILHPYQFTLDDYKNLLNRKGLSIKQTICLKNRRIFDYHLLIAEKL